MVDLVLSTGVVLLVVAVVGVFALCLKRIPANAQGVVLMFGAYRATIGPGLHYVTPVRRVVVVDRAYRSLTIPPSVFALGRDGTVSVAGTVDFHAEDARQFVFHGVKWAEKAPVAFRDSLASDLSTVPAPELASAGRRLAQRTRFQLTEAARECGIQVDRVRITVATPSGPQEFVEGNLTGAPPQRS